ncbi:hypothetical protein A3K63_00865 [Candidatus Micrarchaeota archaeon RBG_16_49_10]|nr:MAG: hypothetical protein A3K63_00865 [Candidatus Micrarchaeota archaeon RBG_16_49_10]
MFIAFLFIAERLLKKIKVKIDREFFLAVIPFIVLGAFVRVIEDAGILKSTLFITPFIWILFFGIIIGLLAFSSLIQLKRGIPYYKIMFVLGIFLSGLAAGTLSYTNLISIFYVSAWFAPFVLLFLFLDWSLENKLISLVQLFDAVTTFVSMKYFGYSEQHVLPNLIINFTGTPFSFVLVKLVVVVFALKIIDKHSESQDTKNLFKFSIMLLGLGPGLRDLIRLVAFV